MKQDRSPLTFPAPMIFSAAYTALEHRGHWSLLPNFCANLLGFVFEVVLGGFCLAPLKQHNNKSSSVCNV